MQQEQTNTPPSLEYATPRMPRPAWVKWGLWGVPNRLSAWLFVWGCVAGAVVAVVLGFVSDDRWFWGIGLLLSAFMYWLSIAWMDRHQGWSDTTVGTGANAPNPP